MTEDSKPVRKKLGGKAQSTPQPKAEAPKRDYRLGRRYRTQAEIDEAEKKAREVRDKTNRAAKPGRHKKRRGDG